MVTGESRMNITLYPLQIRACRIRDGYFGFSTEPGRFPQLAPFPSFTYDQQVAPLSVPRFAVRNKACYSRKDR
jgi:hypothetical protein